MKFIESVAVITGGSSGIGKSVAELLSKEGADIVIADIDVVGANKVAEEIIEHRGKCSVIGADVSNSQDVKKIFEFVLGNFGHVDFLINSAGVCPVHSIEEISEEEWDLVMNVNLKGTFLCSKAVIPAMRKQRFGRIVNFGSIAGKIGGINSGAHYSASKAAIMCLTKSLALYLAPYGITVNAVAPGIIKTPMTQKLSKGEWGSYLEKIPLKEIGDPKDVANAVAFLISDEARYITGEILDVNGGMYMD